MVKQKTYLIQFVCCYLCLFKDQFRYRYLILYTIDRQAFEFDIPIWSHQFLNISSLTSVFWLGSLNVQSPLSASCFLLSAFQCVSFCSKQMKRYEKKEFLLIFWTPFSNRITLISCFLFFPIIYHHLMVNSHHGFQKRP